MQLLRTPDERFRNLPGYPWQPKYVDDLPGYDGIRVHYLDEGVGHRGVALCLHGNPAWSYLYRKMIPVLLKDGLRVVAPDMIGFGRSDKPADESLHTFEFHRTMLLRLVERLDLENVMIVCQDWGGLLGLTLPMEDPRRYTRLLAMNTMLGTGEKLSDGFVQWRDYSNRTPDLEVGRLISRGNPMLTAEEAAAYDAPFPDARYKAALRAFPNMVPDAPDAPGAAISRRALEFLRDRWEGESFVAIGMADPVLGAAAMRPLAKLIRNCPRPLEVAEAGHFTQEWGAPIARAALVHFGLGGFGETAVGG